MIKDSEIDLTQYRDFGDNNIQNISLEASNIDEYIEKNINKEIYGNIPWDFNNLKTIKYKFDGLMILGNSEQRKKQIEERYWGSTENVVCDCCGNKYIKIPWIKNSGLCYECRNSFKNIRELPWNT